MVSRSASDGDRRKKKISSRMFFKGYSKIIDIFSFFFLYVLTSAFCNVTLRGQCKRLGFKNVVPLKWPWRRKMSLNWNEHKNNKKKLWKNDKSVYFMWIFKNLDLCTFRFLCKQIPRSFLFPLKYFKPFEFVKKKKESVAWNFQIKHPFKLRMKGTKEDQSWCVQKLLESRRK